MPPPSPAERKRTLYLKAYEDLYTFARFVLGYDRLIPRVHRDTCDRLQNLKRGERLQILLPRGYFKSRIAAIAYPLWRLVRDPNETGYIMSHSLSLTKAHLREIKKHIRSGRLDFYSRNGTPMYLPACRWTEEEIEIAWRGPGTRGGTPSIAIGSVDVGKEGFHFDFIIEDDLHDKDNVQTRDGIDRVIYAHQQTEPLQDVGKGSVRVVIGTRWAFGDLYENLETEAGWPTVKMGLYVNGNEADGCTFPEEFTPERIALLKRGMFPENFAAQYLNEPISAETQVFRRDMFRVFPGSPPKGTRYMLLDPALSLKKHGDRSGIILAVVSEENRIYVQTAHADRLIPDALMDRLFAMALAFNPDMIGIETVAFQKALKYEFEKRMRAAGRWWPVTELRPDTRTSKEERIKGLAGIYAAGDILHAPGLNDLEDELLRFPKGRHDDLIDALAYLPMIAFPGGTPGVYDPEKMALDRFPSSSTIKAVSSPQGLIELSEITEEDTPDWYDL
jgi:predicted phage terminase large subunit-like protein